MQHRKPLILQAMRENMLDELYVGYVEELLEREDDLGGTWHVNRYPGLAVDIPSSTYSYSFEPRTSWSRKYSPQPEILDYIEHCVDKYELDPHLHLGVTVTRAVFDEVSARWELEAADGRRWSARAVVAGLGALRVPAIPELPGIERFQGAAFHSARWDHSVDLRGKRVAVVGTGASAIQFVPAIAPEVAQLTLFQRTPPWILPKADRAFREGEKAFFGRFPGLERVYRKALYWKHEATAFGFVRHPRFLKVAERMARQHIKASIADPALRAKVTPSFSIGCKRILISNDYYPALNRPNVEVRTDGIAEVRERSVVTGEGREIEVDAILYGTGFAVADFLAPMEVRGIGGRELSEAWRDGAQAYLGTAVVNPVTGPLFYFFELWVGMRLRGQVAPEWESLRGLDGAGWWNLFVDLLGPFLLGGAVVVPVASLLAYLVIVLAVRRWRAVATR